MSRMPSENHAARLRALKGILGQITHPEFERVCLSAGIADPAQAKNTLRKAVREIYAATPLTWRDLLGYARAGRRDVVVRSGKFGIRP